MSRDLGPHGNQRIKKVEVTVVTTNYAGRKSKQHVEFKEVEGRVLDFQSHDAGSGFELFKAGDEPDEFDCYVDHKQFILRVILTDADPKRITCSKDDGLPYEPEPWPREPLFKDDGWRKSDG